jgi:hypothetical protein
LRRRRKTMAIKGVSEVIRLPRLGKIRLGVRRENEEGISYPVPTEYFVCPDEVKKVFGDKPKELRIMFPTEDEKQWSSQYLRCYSASRGLICRGDGEMAVARVDIHTREIATRESQETELLEITCNPAKCAYYQKAQCRRVMNLQFILPDCPGFGVYQLDTSSFFSIVNVNSCLELIQGVCGRLSMIPLSLKLADKEVQVEGKTKTVRVLNLTTPCSLIEIQKYARIPPGQALLLPVPDCEVPDDLFSEEISGWEIAAEQINNAERRLAELWVRAKSRVWQLDVRDTQIAEWFKRKCHLDVRLSDFDLIEPPPQVTLESLEHFLKTLEHHADHI